MYPEPPVELAGTHGKFDFIKVDEARGRLLACHTGNGSLDVIEEATSKLIKSVPTGNAQGVAIDAKGARYFVSCSKPPQLVIVDAAKLEVTGTVSLPEAADLCAYSPKLNWVFVDDDEKAQTWIIDLGMMAILHAWQFSRDSGMEDIAFDPAGSVLVQNIKDTSKLLVVDFAADSYLGSKGPGIGNLPDAVSTLPAEKPHGLAMIGSNRLLIAGGNGTLVLMDYKTGKILAATNIAPKVDEIAYDPQSGNAYCASGTGVISVVSVGNDKFGPTESVTSAPGAHSIAVDPKSTAVWIAFAKGDKSFVQAFPSKAK